MAKKSKAKSGFSVNFEGVGEGFFVPRAGGYGFEIVSAQLSEDNDEQLVCEYRVLDGKYKGQTCRDWFSLGAKSLWRLRKMLTAAGFEVEDAEMDIDFDDLVGLKFYCDVEERDYEGTRKANFVDFSALDVVDDDEDDDPKSKGKGKKAAKEDDEDDEPKAKGKKGKKAEPEEDEDDEDEDDEPKSKGKGKKGKAEKVSAEKVAELDEDELGELNEKHDLEVDLDDYSTLRKKRAAVVAALEEKDLLED